MLLRGRGMMFAQPTTGTTALQTALDYRPNVMLLDIGLPGLDGYEVS